MKNIVTITKDEFDIAVAAVAAANMSGPDFAKNPVGAASYVVGGTLFSKEVAEILFKDEEEEE